MLLFCIAVAHANIIPLPREPSASVPPRDADDVPIDVWTTFAFDGDPSQTTLVARLSRADGNGPIYEMIGVPVNGLLEVPRDDELDPDTDYTLTIAYEFGFDFDRVDFRTGEGLVVSPTGTIGGEVGEVHASDGPWRSGQVELTALEDPLGLVRLAPTAGYQRYVAASEVGAPLALLWPSGRDVQHCVLLEQLDGLGEVAASTTACEPVGCSSTPRRPALWVVALILAFRKARSARRAVTSGREYLCGAEVSLHVRCV